MPPSDRRSSTTVFEAGNATGRRRVPIVEGPGGGRGPPFPLGRHDPPPGDTATETGLTSGLRGFVVRAPAVTRDVVGVCGNGSRGSRGRRNAKVIRRGD